MRDLFQVVSLLIESGETAGTVRAWLIGSNPQLEDRAPIEVFHEGAFDQVRRAAEAFTAAADGGHSRVGGAGGRGRSLDRACHWLAQTPDHASWRGLRYLSRLAPDWECWAVWEPSPLLTSRLVVEKVTREHPALHAAAQRLNVRI